MVESRVEARGEERAKTGVHEAFTLLAVLLASGGLYVALRRPKVEPTATERAFKRLESDVEDLFTRVESHLGRISRLKRGANPPAAAPAVPTVPPKPVTRAGLYAQARRNNADKNRYGASEQRGG